MRVKLERGNTFTSGGCRLISSGRASCITDAIIKQFERAGRIATCAEICIPIACQAITGASLKGV